MIVLHVEEVTPKTIRMRLEGEAPTVQFRLMGYLEVDRAKGAFTRFDVVAFNEKGHHNFRANNYSPLGISFELIKPEKPLDFLPPYGISADWHADYRNYHREYFAR
jgi:hypothetical protein